MNKQALLMIPSLDETVNRHTYLRICAERMMEEGYDPLMPPFYDSQSFYQESFFDRMLPYVDAIFMFINFGVDQAMIDMVERTLNTKEIIYRRIDDEVTRDVYSTPTQVFLDVCSRTNTHPDVMRSQTRQREVVDARFVYYRRAKEKTKASLKKIGEVVNRDHATVLHGVKEAYTTAQVVELYERYYGKTETVKETMEPDATDIDPEQICRPVLPYRSLDPREQVIPTGKSFVHSLSGAGYHQPFGGYRPHNS
jgi:hypothetical protein